MSGSSTVSASQGWFKPLQAMAGQAGSAVSGGGIAQAITQAGSGIAKAAPSGIASLGAVSNQVQSALLSLQSVGSQAGGATTTQASSASLGGMHHHHHGHGSSSDAGDSASLPAAISSDADDITTMPNAAQQSVSKAMQSYFASSSALGAL